MSVNQIIQIKNLLFKWPAQKDDLLSIAELHIGKGEHLFLCGESGSGKSTFLNLLGGVVTPQQGEIVILGRSLVSLSAIQRDQFRAGHIGFIFQQFNLLPYLSIIDNVTLPCHFSIERYKKACGSSSNPENEARRLLNHLGIDDEELITKPVTQLSVGQQQRVAAARALIGSPEIIIADEPTSSLDEKSQKAFVNLLLKEAEAAGSTIILVSHDQRFAAFFQRSASIKGLQVQKQPGAIGTVQ